VAVKVSKIIEIVNLEDYMTPEFVLSWVGTGFQIIGAAALASRILSPRTSYLLMLPGSIIWLGLAVAQHDWALALMQATFTIINAIGLLEWNAI
jgi:hypothetical protein